MMETLSCVDENRIDTQRWSKRLRLKVPSSVSSVPRQPSLKVTLGDQAHSPKNRLSSTLSQSQHPLWHPKHSQQDLRVVWHDVSVFRLRDVITHQLHYVVV